MLPETVINALKFVLYTIKTSKNTKKNRKKSEVVCHWVEFDDSRPNSLMKINEFKY